MILSAAFVKRSNGTSRTRRGRTALSTPAPSVESAQFMLFPQQLIARTTVWALALLLGTPLFAQAPDPALPVAHPDWRVQVVAQSPALKFPTSVACAPDGRVFIGENPIDMTGPPDK